MDRIASTRESDFGTEAEAAYGAARGLGPRHSILDLAPLELECLSALWPMGEGTVRDIHRQLTAARPRAYTTVLTIMDRLAQKGIVGRRKVGRAYRYRANLSADEARWKAVEKIMTGFFDGSAEALAAHLSTHSAAPLSASLTTQLSPAKIPTLDAPQLVSPIVVRGVPLQTFRSPTRTVPVQQASDTGETIEEESLTQELDETLL